MNKTVVVYAEIEVPFHEYPTEAMNQKAKTQITRWVRKTLHDEVSYIDLHVEKNVDGILFDDASKTARIRVKSEWKESKNDIT